MLRRQFLGRFSAFTAGTLGGIGCATSPGQMFRVSSFPRISMSGLYLARERGYFRELGLKIEIKEILNGAHSLALLAGSKLDARFAALNPGLIHSVARGSKIRIVAGREIASTTCGTVGTIYGNAESFPHGLQDLTQLEGAHRAVDGPPVAVLVEHGEVAGMVYVSVGQDDGVDARRVDGRVLPVAQAVLFPALEQAAVDEDASFTGVEQAQQHGHFRIKDFIQGGRRVATSQAKP